MTAVAKLRRLCANRPGVFQTLIQTHIDNSERLLQEMKRALSQGDAAALRQAAHSLKGGTATFGLMAVSECAGAVERAGPEATPQMLEGMVTAWLQARRTLEAELATPDL